MRSLRLEVLSAMQTEWKPQNLKTLPQKRYEVTLLRGLSAMQTEWKPQSLKTLPPKTL